MFPRRYFTAWYFAPRYWPQSQGQAPAPPVTVDIPGLEYTSNLNRLHYVTAVNRIHYTSRDEDR